MASFRRRTARPGPRTVDRLVAGFERSPICAVLADLDGHPLWWNATAAPFVLRDGAPVRLDAVLTDGAAYLADIVPRVAEGSTWEGELVLVDDDGRSVPVSASVSPDTDGDGQVAGFVLVASDVSEHRRVEAALRAELLSDELTGVGSAALLDDRLTHLSARLRRTGRHAAVLAVDIDRLKVVNDGLGRAAGDQLLRSVGQRLREGMRDEDTVARVAADEFCVLVEDLDGPDASRAVAEHILDSLREPFQLDGGTVVVSASIGIARVAHDESPTELLRRADLAMYRAKNRGGARYALYDERITHPVDRRLEIEWALRRRLDDGSVGVRFLPVVELRTGALVLAEAQLESDWPELGRITPAELVAVADDVGLGEHLARRLLELAVAAAALWPVSVSVSVDVTATVLVHGSVAEMLTSACAEAGVSAERVVVEIGERHLADDEPAVSRALAEVRAAGARIALDDFGQALSSLGALRSLPIDVIKLHPSLLGDIGTPATRAVVGAVLGVAEVLDLVVVADGVDTDDRLEIARSLGCQLAQGARIAGSLAADDLDPWFSLAPASD